MIESTPGGVILSIRVIPRSGRSGPARLDSVRRGPSDSRAPGTRDDAFLIRLNAPPVKGAANTELIALLADLLHVPKRSVTIVSGERSRSKRVRVDGVSADQVAPLLQPSRYT